MACVQLFNLCPSASVNVFSSMTTLVRFPSPTPASDSCATTQFEEVSLWLSDSSLGHCVFGGFEDFIWVETTKIWQEFKLIWPQSKGEMNGYVSSR